MLRIFVAINRFIQFIVELRMIRFICAMYELVVCEVFQILDCVMESVLAGLHHRSQ